MRPVFKKIALVGMMGSGKTTLGRLLAARLGWEFVDADTVIEARAGMTIPDIFRQHGEADFRRREEEALREVVGRPGRCVVATGGGAFCRAGARNFLLETALTVFIKVEEEALLSRLAAFDPAGRPMLAGDWRGRVAELVRERYPLYELAHVTLTAGDEPPRTTLERLVAAIGPEALDPEANGIDATEFETAGFDAVAPPPPNTDNQHGVS